MRRAFTFVLVVAQVLVLIGIALDQELSGPRCALWRTVHPPRAAAPSSAQIRGRSACSEPSQTAPRPRTAVTRAPHEPAPRVGRLRPATPVGASDHRPPAPLILRI